MLLELQNDWIMLSSMMGVRFCLGQRSKTLTKMAVHVSLQADHKVQAKSTAHQSVHTAYSILSAVNHSLSVKPCSWL